MFRRTLLLGVFLLTGLHSALATSSASPPVAVVSVQTPTGGWISWMPPTDTGADFYRVYGFSGGDRYLLLETTNLYAGIQGAYGAYAVSSVTDGVESVAVQSCGVDINYPPLHVSPHICL